MNKLKEISNKFYQEVEVVMLATEDVIGEAPIMQEDDKLYPVREFGNRNIYFLSNEKIEAGDYYLDDCNQIRQAVTSDEEYWDRRAGYKKIIATTDTSLKISRENSHLNSIWKLDGALLPQPSQSFIQAFIKAYNEGKPITKVLVEMRSFDTLEYNSNEFKKAWENNKDYILKVNSNNEVIIKKIKDNYTRDEVIEFTTRLRRFINKEKRTIFEINKWVEENL